MAHEVYHQVLTSEEAKSMNCCVVDRRCSGSSCMAWRWNMTKTPVKLEGAHFTEVMEWRRTDKGYCGMPQVEA